MASADVSMFHPELIEIAAYQMSCAITIIKTLATLAADGSTRDDFIQNHLSFLNEVLGKIEEETKCIEENGAKTFKLFGQTKDFFERALFEAEAMKNERQAAKNEEKQ